MGIANPAKLWLLFVLIAGVGFAGYIAVRALGPTRGLSVAGFFAGLVSSTAATLSLSRRAAAEPALAGPLATGIVLANVASAIAQLLIVAVADPALLGDATILIGAPIAVEAGGAVIAAWVFGRRSSARPDATFVLANPLEWKPALVMAAMFALVLFASAVAGRVFGPTGDGDGRDRRHERRSCRDALGRHVVRGGLDPAGRRLARDPDRLHGQHGGEADDRRHQRRAATLRDRRASAGGDGGCRSSGLSVPLS